MVSTKNMSDFYFEHSIGPSHSHHMHNLRILVEQRREGGQSDSNTASVIENLGGVKIFGEEETVARVPETVINGVKHSSGSRKRQRNFVLNESCLDELAGRYGYTKINVAPTGAQLASYRRGVCRLNFWLTTGNVGSYLDHPTRGKTLLVRRDINLGEAESVFQNPMHQIGREYRRTTN